MNKNEKQTGLLSGITILDLADDTASFCTKLLADVGATVIKIEKPGGDDSRKTGPFLNNTLHSQKSLSFFYNNSNKLSITLDLVKSRDRDIFLKLVQQSDVIVETSQPGFLNNIGVGYDTLKLVNPKIILVSVTGFGQSGPRKDYLSCDIVASAYGGQMYISGAPTTPPLRPYGDQSCFSSSLFAAAGTLLALKKRKQSGIGDHVDISIQESVTAFLEHVMVRYFFENIISERQGPYNRNNDFCIVPCEDGHLQMSISQQWETLVEWMDGEGMAGDLMDEKFRDANYRNDNREHIIEVVKNWTVRHTMDELFELGQLMRFPWAPVHSPKQVTQSPHLQARKFFTEIEHPELGASLIYPGVPFTFKGQTLVERKKAPLIGEHNEQIRQEIPGIGDEDIKKRHDGQTVSKSNVMSQDILKGVRVLDFTRVLAGPYATRLLADFGAEVIKVQSKLTATGAELEDSGYFATWNRNKKSITLNLNFKEAKDIAFELVKKSDIVIENFSPRVMKNLGLDYNRLKKVKPDIIMVSMSSMGQTGPWRDYGGFGPTVQSLGGLTQMTAFEKDAPQGLGNSYADPVVGLYGAFTALSALEYRDRTGMGNHIDISGYEAVCASIGPVLMEVFANEKDPVPQGNASDNITAIPHGCYPCKGKDRWCVIAVLNDTQWKALYRLIQHPEGIEDEQFATFSKRKQSHKEIDDRVSQWTKQYAPEKAVEILQQSGVPSGVVQNAEDIANDSHLSARNFFVRLNHPLLGEIMADGTPVRFGKDHERNWKCAPLLGDDNRYVYKELLGFSEEKLVSYIQKGIIE